MILTASHFSAGPLALPGIHYHSHARICALHSRGDLGKTATITYRAHGRRYVLRGVLVADVCGTRGRIDIPDGLYRDLIFRHGGDSGLARVTVTLSRKRGRR